MGRELGRISGPLLANNLKRNGVNLAFETQLLYFDVINNRIGINTTSPTRDLLVNGTSNTNTLLVTTQADLGSNFEITNSQIQNFVDIINIVPNQASSPVISIENNLATDNLNFGSNVVNATTSNTDININPSFTPQIGERLVLQHDAAGNTPLPFYAGGGNQYVSFPQLLTASDMAIDEAWMNNSATVTFNDGSVFPLSNAGISGSYGYIILPIINNILSKTANNIWPMTITSVDYAPELDARIVLNNDTLVTGNVHATGNITWDGNVTLGNAPTDTITFEAEVNSDILPSANQVDNLGSNSLQWNNLYTNNLNIVTGYLPTLTAGTMTAGGVSVNQNTIINSNSSTDITLTPSGTGKLQLTNSTTSLTDSTITNNSNNVLTIAGTNNGYTKFDGANGVVIPSGTTQQRPNTPEQGTTRYNSDLGYPEVYDNTLGWIPVRGTATIITNSEVNDITGIWALVLGL